MLKNVPGQRILFVESDDPGQRSLSATLDLSDSEWIVMFASNADKALELNRTDPFDIVVAENNLPGKTGMELIKSLKMTSPGTIRFLAIEESEVFQFRSLISDAHQILLKPLEQEAFVQKLSCALSLREIVHDPKILRVVGNAEDLPSLPRVFQSLCTLLNNPNASLVEVADLISEDIVLSSKVLKLANSALYSLREPAHSCSYAVSLLGSSAVSSLVFSQGVQDTFRAGSDAEQFAEDLNWHCIECANLVSNILLSWGAKRALIDKAFFCGMAHDLGKLVMMKFVPEQWKEIQTRIETSNVPDVALEREVLGVSHCEIAAYVLAVWGFPLDEVTAIAFHHEPSKIKEHEPEMLCALHLADNLCNTKLHGADLDWSYLSERDLTMDDVTALKALTKYRD